ncbi:Ribosomal L11 methyltransferase, PrmA [Kalmanozyma brasiliensis GHG001]|uniref:type I protein arginine methyltransferase n=1 Tax=Kalmanozyma brasiliensis (strain GHG001) TaxID=1365824 RepID=V5EFP5_KALBG|nr:Ribosomal L11 methyltransferase, PrmA [Kalmanozyma brasiliensis GHG001]EST09336.1 Ribosomal L11 methyltransferase, PrmA [Kalmanozyma brasiliensis GHG001]
MVHKDPEGYISDSSSSIDDDNDYGDWRSDDDNAATTLALFADSSTSRPSFASPLEALAHAKSQGCDLAALVARLELDTLQVIRLINHIRRNNLTPEQVNAITRDSGVLLDDAELKPVPGFEDDGLLQVDFDLLALPTSSDAAGSSEKSRIAELESQLATARAAFEELRTLHATTLGLTPSDLTDSSTSQLTAHQRSSLATSAARTKRGANDAEDDILYFDSYSTNGIHQTMITDSARTLSYAQFLLHPSNSHLIRGKVVMDVGCGTGILSLFAARAGAKQVIAIDASAIVERARENVEANGFGHVVKVHRGKLEDFTSELEAWEGKVDVLVSEWMGYFLLYENMLPSVLLARDRYLNPETGVLAPNRMTMHLAAFSSSKLINDKLRFWDDVHGFNMTSMTTGLLDEAFVDVLDKDDVVSDSYVFADLDLPRLPVKQPEPESSFELTISADGSVHGFISWFDTFFFPSARVPTDASTECPKFSLEDKDVVGLDLKKNATTATGDDEGKGELVSFSTSPYSKETHWQQTLFVLKEPITGVQKGDKIKGRIVVLQDQKHSRQLEVELHYLHVPASTERPEGKKKVETQLVQVFMVR